MEPQWVRVTVHPKSGKNILIQVGDGHYEAWVKAKPAEGRANEAVVQLLIRHLGVPRSRLRMTKGRHRRHKVFRIIG